MIKSYTFELTIHTGSDEFWESNPTDKDVRQLVIEALASGGIWIIDDSKPVKKRNVLENKLKLTKSITK